MHKNRERLAEQRAHRRALLKHAAVAWADRKKVTATYRSAMILTRETGTRHEVDHVIPIVNPLVCGLHNEFNLKVIPLARNRRKSNKFTPVQL